MTIPVINIITLVTREDRQQSVKYQIEGQKQYAPQYRFWYGITDTAAPHKAISLSHKRIVQYAKDRKDPFVIIAEDDLKFCSPNSWQTFMKKLKALKSWDILLGGVSGGEILNEKNGDVYGWSGLFFYAVHENFYDAFLSADPEQNIDRWLSLNGMEAIEKKLGRKPIYQVCYPIIAICIDGVSDNSKEFIVHEKYFRPYKKLI